jgi:hypothetical protein
MSASRISIPPVNLAAYMHSAQDRKAFGLEIHESPSQGSRGYVSAVKSLQWPNQVEHEGLLLFDAMLLLCLSHQSLMNILDVDDFVIDCNNGHQVLKAIQS